MYAWITKQELWNECDKSDFLLLRWFFSFNQENCGDVHANTDCYTTYDCVSLLHIIQTLGKPTTTCNKYQKPHDYNTSLYFKQVPWVAVQNYQPSMFRVMVYYVTVLPAPM